MSWLFMVGCGVLQGCPLSASLFVVAIDPLLLMFEKHLHDPLLGTVRACGDDIGATVRGPGVLLILHGLFERMRKASGLTLKPAKCVLIPLCCECSESNVGVPRQWLRQYLPQWAEIDIKGMGKYLGVFVGPSAGDKQVPRFKDCWFRD